jgi:predicted permease
MLADLRLDLRYGVRALRRSPGFTAMVVLSVALGIGANGAIFSLVNAVLLRPLPVREPSRLVLLADGASGGTLTPLLVVDGRLALYSYPLYRRLREQIPQLAALAAQDSNRTRTVFRRGQAAAEMASARLVSASYFAVLGVSASLGRTFLPGDETAPGANPVIVLSHRMWQRRFGGDPSVIGASLTVNGASYTVVGVTPPGFNGATVGEPTDFWVPITMQAELRRGSSLLADGNTGWLLVLGRLAPAASMAAAETRANAVFQQFAADDPAIAGDKPLHTRIVVEEGAQGIGGLRIGFRQPLLVLMAAVGLLLLIVCLNVSHLLLARGTGRQREIGVRTALGATRARLVRQLLTEGLLLAALGATAGAVTWGWLTDGLLAMTGIALDVHPDARVVAFIAGVALATALLLGLVPAWQAARSNLQEALRATSPAVSARSNRLASRTLLVSQVAVSLVLLVGAGLLSASLSRLRHMDKGFDEEHVLLVSVLPRLAGISEDQALAMYDDLQSQVEALPGVRSASLSVPALLTGQSVGDIAVPGRPDKEIRFGLVTPRYFETIGMTLLRGRSIQRSDSSTSRGVIVVTETLADTLMGGVDAAVGKHVRFGNSKQDLEVVGVVRDALTAGLRRGRRPMAFLPVAQRHDFLNSLEVRATGDPALLADRVRATIRAAYPDLPIPGTRTLGAVVGSELTQDRLLAVLSSAFGLAALFLVCIGLYGVIAQWTGQRTREIGVRMALGATTAEVRWLVLRQGFALMLLGLLVGLPAALAAARTLKSLLFGVPPVHAPSLAAAALILLAVATLAAYLPARRASRVDPMMALRCE